MNDLSQEIRQFCSQNHLKLNTDLGQHFLVDQSVLDSIVKAANIQSDDHIVEIGPGIGVLTRELIKTAKKVTAIELDERMIPLIQQFLEQQLLIVNCVLLIARDTALKFQMPEDNYKIVANIPYHITSPLLRHIFLESKAPLSLTLLIQREVAEKICDTENAGILTILVALFGKPRIVTHVPPESFLPPPKVDSSVLHIDCFNEPVTDPETIEEIFKLTKIAFSQKRKMLRKCFGAFPGVIERLSALKIDEKRRPQTLSLEEWIDIAQATKDN